MTHRNTRTLTVTARDGFPLAVQLGGEAGVAGDVAAVDAVAGDVAAAQDRKAVLLLLPGQANSHRWWDRLRPAFEDAFVTVTFDYRGTGGSREAGSDTTHPEVRETRDAWSTASFADDAADVLRALGVKSAAVYGASMGGRVAQQLAIRHPALVSALVLACTSPGGSHAEHPSEEARSQFAGVGATDAAHRLAMLHDMFYTPAWTEAPAASPLLGDRSMSPGERGAHRRVSGGHDAWDELPRITARTLVLHGSTDRVTPPENATLLAARIPDARALIYSGGRHGFFDEFAHEVSRDVQDFLTLPPHLFPRSPDA